MREKIKAIEAALNNVFLERKDALRATLAAILARQHVFMIGPPGTAKSTMLEKFCKAVTGAKYFEWLMDRFTQPEDVFGPTKISKLKQDEYERNTEDTLVDSHIVFLDEIWKSHSGILNTLLRVMDGSRRFYNNRKIIQTPLISLIGASNELPENGELNALWDRFLVRIWVDDIIDDANFKQIFEASRSAEKRRIPTIDLADLQAAQVEVEAVAVPNPIAETITALRAKLKAAGFSFSARRWVMAYHLLQAAAWLAGRQTVELEDLEILKDVFWNVPGDRRDVGRIIAEMVNPDLARALEILDKAQEVHDNAVSTSTTKAGMEANEKFKTLARELDGLSGPRVEEIRNRIADMQREILATCLGFSS